MQLPMIEEIRVRCSIDLKARLEKAARDRGQSVSDLTREALLARLASDVPPDRVAA